MSTFLTVVLPVSLSVGASVWFAVWMRASSKRLREFQIQSEFWRDQCLQAERETWNAAVRNDFGEALAANYRHGLAIRRWEQEIEKFNQAIK